MIETITMIEFQLVCYLRVILFVKILRNPPVVQCRSASPSNIGKWWRKEALLPLEEKRKKTSRIMQIWWLFCVSQTELLPFRHFRQSRARNDWFFSSYFFFASNAFYQYAWFDSLSIMTYDCNRALYIYKNRISSRDVQPPPITPCHLNRTDLKSAIIHTRIQHL